MMYTSMMNFPEEVIEHVFDFVMSNRDRNSISMVCKTWYDVERLSRKRVFIQNCYVITPQMLISRFPRFRSLCLKGKPHSADFSLVPHDWGGDVYPWIEAFAKASINLEELRLKKMLISNDCLNLVARSFPNFKSLVLVCCEGFSTDGLAAIASNCRFLRELDLQENKVEDRSGQWLSCFPDSCTSLVSLNFACLKGEVNLATLERLVARCRNLINLRVNHAVPIEALQKMLVHAPQLVDLGVGSLVLNPDQETYKKLKNALQKCTSVRSLSGFLGGARSCLPAFYPVCANLTSLVLSCAPRIYIGELVKLIRHCRKLECLWIPDTIGDRGLQVVASTCKELKELRVFPSNLHGVGNAGVTEEGLVAISAGCPKIKSLLYYCQRMTNAALITVAKECPNFIHFRLCTSNPTIADAVTMKPLDEGFGAIVQSCKSLKRLSVSGLVSDQVFLYIGMYGEQLEMLSIAFGGESDKGMLYVLNGCKKLKKLEIRDSPFGDVALVADVGKYERMRWLWMSSCEVTLGACKTVAKKMGRLVVEIMKEGEQVKANSDDRLNVGKMYLYRTLVGARTDAPDFVWTL